MVRTARLDMAEFFAVLDRRDQTLRLCEQFLDRDIRPRYKHPGRIDSLFKRDVLPVIGKLAPLEVKPAEVDRVLRRISGDGRPTVANDALRLERDMEWR